MKQRKKLLIKWGFKEVVYTYIYMYVCMGRENYVMNKTLGCVNYLRYTDYNVYFQYLVFF